MTGEATARGKETCEAGKSQRGNTRKTRTGLQCAHSARHARRTQNYTDQMTGLVGGGGGRSPIFKTSTQTQACSSKKRFERHPATCLRLKKPPRQNGKNPPKSNGGNINMAIQKNKPASRPYTSNNCLGKYRNPKALNKSEEIKLSKEQAATKKNVQLSNSL